MNSLDGRLKVLHVTVEMAPLVKLGGVGDVVMALPKTLRRRSVDARILLPAYPGAMECVKNNGYSCSQLEDRIHVALDSRVYSAKVFLAEVDEVPVYLLDQPELFTNPNVYPHSLSQATMMPFAFLSLAALEIPGCADWKPDVIHAHDWPTSIIPLALRWHKHYMALR